MAFRAPTRLIIEAGRGVASVKDSLSTLKKSKPLLLVDPGLSGAPWLENFRAGLNFATLPPDDIRAEANPRLENAYDIAAFCREKECDSIVAVGGGSAIDAAKAAAMLATNVSFSSPLQHSEKAETVRRFIGRNIFTTTPLPFIAVPTTCGTGSEVTWVSVLSDTVKKEKVSIKGDGMFPDCAVVDALLLRSLPPSILAATAMDALTHAIEAAISARRNPASTALAHRAIDLIFLHLPAAFLLYPPLNATEATDPTSVPPCLSALAEASSLAGLAFSNADVGAVHCLSESLGGIWDVPHGLCNAVLLQPVVGYQLHKAGPGSDVSKILASIGRRLSSSLFHRLASDVVEGKAQKGGLKKSVFDQAGYERYLSHVLAAWPVQGLGESMAQAGTEADDLEWARGTVRAVGSLLRAVEIGQPKGKQKQRSATAEQGDKGAVQQTPQSPFVLGLQKGGFGECCEALAGPADTSIDLVSRSAANNNSNESNPVKMNDKDYKRILRGLVS
uniref:Uncharacterized protein n=1 Tax=Chromera velia CCMP2878 TaxID=1169474 RepID=A0A0G4HRD5_9ALVE|eukprot:Cvel_8076.t1-p1 / transcript=Cvel_8076.t1 / gene=Cvel_8076 / organism=Chromera_velia_CCMP2878 / gene_product=1,3-propanediol dehydrogenase, putative / transcript_product=1,3-propanediol dehydrogenase, putative / location=Cvel_scaffold438:5872-8827(-) / protein_length=503 / sequence_SO=supercontig / SO=protein_coding / is_pseudo=false